MRRREAAAGDFLAAASDPCDFDILAACGKLDQLAEAAVKPLGLRTIGEVHRNDRGEMARPFALHKILIVARGDDVPAEDISFIDPIFVEQDLVFAATAETAIEDMIAAFEGL